MFNSCLAPDADQSGRTQTPVLRPCYGVDEAYRGDCSRTPEFGEARPSGCRVGAPETPVFGWAGGS